MAANTSMGQLDLIANFTDGSTDSITLTPGDPHGTIEFIPGENDIDKLTVKGLLGDIISEVVFVEDCIPEFPLYIRWINTTGGYEYYMFKNAKSVTRSVNPTNFTLGESYRHDALRSTETLKMTLDDVVECGESNLNLDMFRMLSEIITSPRIDSYNIDYSQWEGMVIDSKSSFTWDTRNSRGEINLKLKLLSQPIQI